MRKFFCWLLGHAFLCIKRYSHIRRDKVERTESTFICQFCNKKKCFNLVEEKVN